MVLLSIRTRIARTQYALNDLRIFVVSKKGHCPRADEYNNDNNCSPLTTIINYNNIHEV